MLTNIQISDTNNNFSQNKNLCLYEDNSNDIEFKTKLTCVSSPKQSTVKIFKQKSRREILQDALLALAERHNIHISFKGTMAYVTTIAGEWYFNFTDTSREIKLHHKNYKKITDANGNWIPGYFHIQEQQFTSPLSVVSYIAKHEKALENQQFISKASQISSRIDNETGFEVLCLEKTQLYSGDSVTALFPCGWKRITICFRNCARTGPKWYIQNCQFANFSPVGLFAVNIQKNKTYV